MALTIGAQKGQQLTRGRRQAMRVLGEWPSSWRSASEIDRMVLHRLGTAPVGRPAYDRMAEIGLLRRRRRLRAGDKRHIWEYRLPG